MQNTLRVWIPTPQEEEQEDHSVASHLGGHGSVLQIRIIAGGLLDSSQRALSTSSPCLPPTHFTIAVCLPVAQEAEQSVKPL